VNALLSTACLQAAKRAMESNHWAESLPYYEKAIQLTPSEAEAYAGKAAACVQLRQFADAAGALKSLATLEPENPTIYLSLGDVFFQEGNIAEARRQWEKAKPLIATGDGGLRAAVDERLSGRITPETLR
jgi:Flp pilus assembly protein TadD